ncbi:hypothetical protein [Streptomyces sp. NPDC059786]|uniref:hypothetical protein n=1 Tax=Streptomyces sp. NPDC059786 TaxID=3346946 RepID=UPI003650D386
MLQQLTHIIGEGTRCDGDHGEGHGSLGVGALQLTAHGGGLMFSAGNHDTPE